MQGLQRLGESLDVVVLAIFFAVAAIGERVYYWETPLADCGNGEEDCKDYNDWVKAWTSIKG